MTKFENQTLNALLYMKMEELKEQLRTEEDEHNREVLERMLKGLDMYDCARAFLI